MMKKEELASKIKGSLLGGALGDALGYAVEFDYYRGIQHDYGLDGIRDLSLRNGKAIISDDTQMTIFTLNALIGYLSKEYPWTLDECVYMEYLNWLYTQMDHLPPKFRSNLLEIDELFDQRAPGNTCLTALRSGTMGTIEKRINDSKGCGGVMRTAPLGFVKSDEIEPLMEGAKAGAITHGHAMGFIPAGMLSDIVCSLIYQENEDLKKVILKSLKNCSLRFVAYPQMKEFDKMIRNAILLAEDKRISDVDAIHKIGGGWVGDEALAIAIFSVLRHSDNIKECLICAVNHDGDSDSTGAIAGNILGAYLGLKAIDKDWIAKLELADLMEKLADKLLELI